MKSKPHFAEKINMEIDRKKVIKAITSLAFLFLTICGSITLTLGVLIGGFGGFSVGLSGLLTTVLSGYTTVVEMKKL
jgi:hypothetical protein